MSKAITLALPIKPEWLDMTVELLADTRDRDEIRKRINEYTSHYIKSSINVRKTREILISTWVEVENENQELRGKALEIFKECPQEDRIAVHWAMMLMAFPIFKDLCAIVGKLSAMEIKKRKSISNRE